MEKRKAIINRRHALPIKWQAELVYINRSSVYYRPKPANTADLALMRRIDELHLEHSYCSSPEPGTNYGMHPHDRAG